MDQQNSSFSAQTNQMAGCRIKMVKELSSFTNNNRGDSLGNNISGSSSHSDGDSSPISSRRFLPLECHFVALLDQ